MEFLGVGPLEIFFILILALIVLGPRDMVKTGRQLGGFLRRIVKSETWQAIQQTSRDIRYLPNKLMRESGIDAEMEEIEKIGKELEVSAKEMETTVKEMGASVKEEVDAAVKDMDVSVPIDDLEKTAREINQDISSIATPSNSETQNTIASPPPPAQKEEQQPVDMGADPQMDVSVAEFELEVQPNEYETIEKKARSIAETEIDPDTLKSNPDNPDSGAMPIETPNDDPILPKAETDDLGIEPNTDK